YYVVIPLLFIPSSHRSAPPSFPTRRSSDLRIGAASLTRIRIRDHEVTERRKLGLRVQHDAAPRELDCLVKIAAIETELCEKQMRSEEHTSELQSLAYLVCRLLLEKKKTQIN